MASESHTLFKPSETIEIPLDWIWRRLDNLCEGAFDCPHSTPVLSHNGPYLARSQDIRSGVFRADEAARVSEDTYGDRIARAEPRHGDLLYSREGTYFGIAAEVPKGIRLCLGQRMVLLRPNPSIIDFRFLRYWLNSPIMAMHTLGRRDGSVAERLNLPTIRGLPIAVPPLRDQRAIAHILGTLDDKIELNRRMNEALEAIARSLFKSWFVDFDPVRAKAEGRDPGLPKPLTGLFPSRLVDSELGEIPEGWGVTSLGELAAIRGGKQLSTEECKTVGTFSVFGANGVMGYAERTTHAEFVVAFGRVGAYCGSVHWTYSGAWINNNASSVVPGEWPEFVLQLMLETDFEVMRTGSAQPFIPNSSLASAPSVRPPDDLLHRFCALAKPLRLKQQRSENQSRTVAAIRDTLLPKLISGELRVPDSQRIAAKRIL
jgi:type I restriction enzyme S subunit